MVSLFKMNEQSYSHVDNKNIPLDKKLDALFENKRNGVFIELGAFDGLTQSNTAFFEFYREWTGLLIEPSKKSYESCVENRPKSTVLNCCCVSSSYNLPSIRGDFHSSLMSSVDGQRVNSDNLIDVNVSTLDKIINENLKNKKIDFLSIDAEGYEFEILKGLNININRPKYILIEIYNKDYNEIRYFLHNNKYLMHSNFSNYNSFDNPNWDKTHNDYLFYDANNNK